MSTRRRRGRMLTALVAVAVLGASTVAVGGAAALAQRLPAKRASAVPCPLRALQGADEPVEITFWHSMAGANEEALERLTDRFNSSQSDVEVRLVNQTSYRDTFDKYVAGLSTGDLPDLVQLQEIALQQAIDTQTILPAQACVKADDYDLADHVDRVVDYYTVGKTLWALPFNASTPVFFYDEAKFEAAGLDPEAPPANFDEVKAAAEKLRDAGVVSQAPMGIKLDPGHVEQWLALADKPYVNNGNGRTRRATAAVFDVKAGVKAFRWLSDMVGSDLAVTNAIDGQNAFDNLFGIGNGNLAMTIDTSANLGTISQVLGSGQFEGVRLGVGPMPGPRGKGGLLVGGAAVYLVNRSSKAKQAAAWEFAKFLDEPETQAEWAAGTGYVPIRESAVGLPAVQELWAREPGYKVAYDQLTEGVQSLATAGPVIGDYQGVRDVVLEAENSMFDDGTSPKAALRRAVSAATAVMDEYNSRIGV